MGRHWLAKGNYVRKEFNKMRLESAFQTSKLDQVLSDHALYNEQERQKLLLKTLNWLDKFGSQYGIQKAYVFGSVAEPRRFSPRSDIDIAVEQINPEHFFMIISLLSEALERDVDIIEINKCHFANQIRQTGIVWTVIN